MQKVRKNMSKKKNKKGGDAWWIGTIIGVIIGIATDHLAVCICFGIAIGFLIDELQKKK